MCTRTHCPRVHNISEMDLLLARRSVRSCCNRRWCFSVERLMRLAGGSSRATLTRSMDTAASSICRASIRTHRGECECLVRLAKALFHSSQTLLVRSWSVMVTSWTFHSAGGNSWGTRRKRMKTRRLKLGRRTARVMPRTYVTSKYATSSSSPGTSGVCWLR